MTVRLDWSELALNDREEIFSYIEADNPRAAVEMDLGIRTRQERCSIFQRQVAPAVFQAHENS